MMTFPVVMPVMK